MSQTIRQMVGIDPLPGGGYNTTQEYNRYAVAASTSDVKAAGAAILALPGEAYQAVQAAEQAALIASNPSYVQAPYPSTRG